MNDAVAGRDIGRSDRGPVDGDGGADAEGQWVAVDGRGRHAIGDVSGGYGAVQHVVEQDVRKGGFAFGRVKGSEVNASIGEGLVGRGEDGERSGALERLEQFGLHDGAHQRVVNTGALCGSGDVVGGVGGHEHRVDDVDDTVAGVDVGDGHGGVVDHHAVADGEREGLSVDRFRRHALRKGRGGDVAGHHVVEQNVGQGLLAFGGVKGGKVDAGVGKGLVGRSKQGEGPGALERFQQFGLDHGAHQ